MSLIRMAKIKKSSTSVYEDVEQLEDKHCWWEYKLEYHFGKLGIP